MKSVIEPEIPEWNHPEIDPKAKRRVWALALGLVFLGLIYGFLIGLTAWLILPYFFARDCYRQLEVPWKLK